MLKINFLFFSIFFWLNLWWCVGAGAGAAVATDNAMLFECKNT